MNYLEYNIDSAINIPYIHHNSLCSRSQNIQTAGHSTDCNKKSIIASHNTS